MTPELHAALLAVASAASVAFAFLILARNPRSVAARLHAVYGLAAGWWFVCVALMTTGNDLDLWVRLAHLSIGMLPGIIFHLNVSTAGVAQTHRRRIRWHYAVSVAITLLCVSGLVFAEVPNQYPWGPYAAYSWLGLLPVGALAVTFAEVLWIYRQELQHAEEGSLLREKLHAFYQGNIIATLCMVDFLPAFGIGVYPFAFVVLTFLNAATMFGSVRFRLVEITPETAAEQILETLPEAVIAVDARQVIRLANNAASRLFGHDVSTLVDARLADVVAAPELLAALALPASAPSSVNELTFRGPDGRDSIMRIADRVLFDQRDAPIARVWVLQDLTAQRLAEAEKEKYEGWVRKGQHLESLGVLAGGIAHDFNNLLTVILGQADIALDLANAGRSIDEQLSAIISASHRAEELTAQMLTYAGRGDASRSLVDLNAVTQDMGELLQVALSKNAEIVFDLEPHLPLTFADEGQVSQVILNLVTNASDALGEGPGVITLRTRHHDTGSTIDRRVSSGEPHVVLEVSDTGAGMDQRTKEHVFDPFFTTKFTGRGLGLATVFGIVQAHGGSIRVESELGAGSCFTVALPAAVGEAARPASVATPSLRGVHGLALVVDDEDGVRRVLDQMLSAVGFGVVEASDGHEAVEVFRSLQDEISVVLLDVTMPKMDGREALELIRSHALDVPVIVMTGFAGASVDIDSDPNTCLMRKPFREADLADRLQWATVDGRR